MKNRIWLSMIGVVAVTGFAGAAQAAEVYDTSLVDPGVYFGSGNDGQNFGWTVNTVGGVELGLTTIHAYVGGLHPGNGNYYYVPIGNDAGAGHADRAYWNFDFSVNLLNSGLTINDVTATGSIYDFAHGTSVSGNVLTAFPDTQGRVGSGPIHSPYQATDTAFQNSENLVFSQFADLNYDENINDTFYIVLSLSGPSGFIGSVDEWVVVGAGAPTPLPAALPLFATGAGVLGALGWRRKKKTSAKA
jgi:hypothetical protein